MEMLIGLLAGLDPVTALFVFISAAEALYIAKELRTENALEKDLRNKIETLNETHHEMMKACQDARIDDLKDLVQQYDTSTKLIATALNKLGRKQ